MKIINRTVLILSFVSLFADMASEMLYPVIPVYLQTIGFSILLRDARQRYHHISAYIIYKLEYVMASYPMGMMPELLPGLSGSASAAHQCSY